MGTITDDYIRRSYEEVAAHKANNAAGAEIASLGNIGWGVLEDLTQGRSIGWLVGIFGFLLTEGTREFVENLSGDDRLGRTRLRLAIAISL